MQVKGEITFDTFHDEEDMDCVDGCYRVGEEDWKIFYFSHRTNGKLWQESPYIRSNVAWPSGVTGIDVVYPIDKPLNRETVKMVLTDVLGGNIDWTEVRGPDSLQLK